MRELGPRYRLNRGVVGLRNESRNALAVKTQRR